jgi:tRNA U34 5-methylaminomethyl-2-thiouridine-forming methyltransferase MnmC
MREKANIQPMRMRFTLQSTEDGSLTVFDQEAGECFKSRHAARTEAEHVFYGPAVLENPHYGRAEPFRVLELGFGLGTNFLHVVERGFRGEFLSLEKDLSGARFFLENEANLDLGELVRARALLKNSVHARLFEEDFFTALPRLARECYRAHAIFFDPFSPKANPSCWTAELFRLAAAVLEPGGRLVTYSVSRAAKDGAAAAGLKVEKRDLPPSLKKRAALVAWKPLAE